MGTTAGTSISPAKLSVGEFLVTGRADFQFAPFNVLLLVVLMLVGLIAHVLRYEFNVTVDVYAIGAALVLAGVGFSDQA